MRDFILFSAGAPALFRGKGEPFSRYLMQLLCRFDGKNGSHPPLRQAYADWGDRARLISNRIKK